MVKKRKGKARALPFLTVGGLGVAGLVGVTAASVAGAWIWGKSIDVARAGPSAIANTAKATPGKALDGLTYGVTLPLEAVSMSASGYKTLWKHATEPGNRLYHETRPIVEGVKDAVSTLTRRNLLSIKGIKFDVPGYGAMCLDEATVRADNGYTIKVSEANSRSPDNDCKTKYGGTKVELRLDQDGNLERLRATRHEWGIDDELIDINPRDGETINVIPVQEMTQQLRQVSSADLSQRVRQYSRMHTQRAKQMTRNPTYS